MINSANWPTLKFLQILRVSSASMIRTGLYSWNARMALVLRSEKATPLMDPEAESLELTEPDRQTLSAICVCFQ
jgi:hypothetical protein